MSITLDRLRALKRQAGDTRAAATIAGVRAEPVRGVPVVDGEPQPASARRDPVKQPLPAHLPSTPTASTPGAASSDEGGIATPQPASQASVVAPGAPVRGGDNDRPQPPVQPAHDPSSNAHGPVPSGPHACASITALRRLLGVRERRPFLPPAPRAPVDRRLPGTEIAPGLHCVETRLPFATPAAALPLAFARRDTHVDPRALLFFDTETTGLAGGTGTRAFMIGAADWVDDTLRVRQLLIATMAAETAMLREFATWLTPATVLASYNGRSYDAPLLKTRYRLARLPDPLHALDHVDLLHPTRRRYRGRWENCRLATIERELLKIVREDDLPGSQAPGAWLGFLRGGASTLLHRVCAHNHQDVVTLAQLMLRLVEAQAAD